MTTITYKIAPSTAKSKSNYLWLNGISNGSSDRVEFKIPGAERGELILGKLRLRLCRGEADISISELDDGRYAPKLILSGRIYYGTPFIKSGKALYRAEADMAQLEALEGAYLALCEELALLSAEVERLSKLIGAKEIFKL